MARARLWAGDGVLQLLQSGDSNGEAGKLAARYQLVTPVSGAVVLESKAQFEGAGLQPVDPGSVPVDFESSPHHANGPEPASWALVLLVGVVLSWECRRRVRRRAPAPAG